MPAQPPGKTFWLTVPPPSPVAATRRQVSAYRSAKYCLPLRSKLMSVSPPPGGSVNPASALGGGPGEITRNVCPPSTEPNQVLRCVPVPVGPLTKTRPWGSIPMSGSPLVWMGSTTVGTWKVIGAVTLAAVSGCADVPTPNPAKGCVVRPAALTSAKQQSDVRYRSGFIGCPTSKATFLFRKATTVQQQVAGERGHVCPSCRSKTGQSDWGDRRS